MKGEERITVVREKEVKANEVENIGVGESHVIHASHVLSHLEVERPLEGSLLRMFCKE